MKEKQLSLNEVKDEQASFLASVYGWMTIALIITGVVAYGTASSPNLVNTILGNNFIFYGILIGQLLCVVYLSRVIHKISASLATLIFLGYAALNGLSFSLIFLQFTADSIASTFLITAGTFGVMSIYGYFTKSDLTKMGNLAIMALVGLILASVVNMFYHNETFYWVTTLIGVLIFVALIASDTQKLKQLNVIGNEETDEGEKEAIMGALTLYLDFINIFMYFIRIFGKRK